MQNFLITLLKVGLLSYFFFIPLFNVKALTLDYKEIDIPDKDVINYEIVEDTIFLNYFGDDLYTDDKDEIFYNGYRIGDTYKLYPERQHIFTGGKWKHFEYATTSVSSLLKSSVSSSKKSGPFTPYSAFAQSFYTGAGDGYVDNANDGHGTWDLAHDDTTAGTRLFPTSATGRAGSGYTPTVYLIERLFTPVDTSSLDDDIEILTVSLFLKVSSIVNQKQDAYDWISVIESTQTDPTDLVSGDLGNCGATDNPTELIDNADRQGVGSTTVGNFAEFVFNSTGTSTDVINREGYTKLCLREGHDITDTSPGTNLNYVYYYMSEQTGTADDPYLLITATSTPEGEGEGETEAATTTAGNVPYNNELSMIVGYTEIHSGTSSDITETRYHYFHIPFFLWVIILIPGLWLANRILIEFIIRLRQKL